MNFFFKKQTNISVSQSCHSTYSSYHRKYTSENFVWVYTTKKVYWTHILKIFFICHFTINQLYSRVYKINMIYTLDIDDIDDIYDIHNMHDINYIHDIHNTPDINDMHDVN